MLNQTPAFNEQHAGPPRPLFTYGTLNAVPLLAWALTGDCSNINAVTPLIRPARIYGFARYSLRGRDYPAAIKSDDAKSAIDGHLITFQTTRQRTKLHDFEGEAYRASPVTVHVLDEAQEPPNETIEADVYLWNGSHDELLQTPWDLDTFIKERLQDWLDLFEGMELTGGEHAD